MHKKSTSKGIFCQDKFIYCINSILTERFPFTSLLRVERKVGKKINYKLKKGVLCCKEQNHPFDLQPYGDSVEKEPFGSWQIAASSKQ